MSPTQTKDLPASFRRIRLELAREPAHPDGDARIAYVLLAPLTADGRLDADVAREFREHCVVVRLRPDQDKEEGYLRRRPGGSWAFHYDLPDGDEDDDPGYRLGDHRFVADEYVTIQEDEGDHTYRVVSVMAP
jgi:hypothetical protein